MLDELDGGNTAGLLNDINNQLLSSAVLEDNLIAASPLSDIVIVALWKIIPLSTIAICECDGT